jgi:hypothetical protein
MFKKRVDKNQKDIVKKFRELGFTVVLTHTIGQGYPDLNCGKEGYTILGLHPELEEFLAEKKIPYLKNATLLVEVKDKTGKLTSSQEKFIEEWTGNYVIVRTDEDVELLCLVK